VTEKPVDADATVLPRDAGADSAGAAPETAALIAGRFELRERLGGGGMGVVYRALDRLAAEQDDPDPYVALKLLGEAIRENPDAALALQREGRRARELAHPNIVKVFDFGRDRDTWYLQMELLRGHALDAIVAANPDGVAFESARPIITQLLAGLAYAHAQGLVHSDIKPSNVFLTAANVVKILDFGIATPFRSRASDGATTKFNSRRLGALSPLYSCVEMFLGSDADPRDDVFSAAVVVYELLSGRHPFDGEEAPRAEEADLRVTRIPGLGGAQNRALRRALRFRRKDRTRSIEDFAASLLGERTPGRARALALRWAAAVVVALALAAGVTLLWKPETGAALGSSVERLRSGAVPLRAEGPCPELERRWGTDTCPQEARDCFASRANAVEISRIGSSPVLEPMFRSLADLYRGLSVEPCESLAARYLQEVDAFQRRYPGQAMN
jgi:serine/threonine protein kinase